MSVSMLAGKGRQPQRTGPNCMGSVRAMRSTIYALEIAASSGSMRENHSLMLPSMHIESEYEGNFSLNASFHAHRKYGGKSFT